jgi:hypothetical protein
MSQQNPYAPPKAQVADVVGSEVAPALWNPNAAASWSLLFSPIFGAFLHMRNWEALGQPAKAAKSKIWFIGSIVVFVFITLAAFFMPDSKGLDLLARVGGFALLIAWYYGIAKSQQAFVIERFGNNYPRRGWLKPILAALGVVFALFVVVFILLVAVDAASGAA